MGYLLKALIIFEVELSYLSLILKSKQFHTFLWCNLRQSVLSVKYVISIGFNLSKCLKCFNS